MISVDLMSLWAFVCSVHLCKSVRKNMSFFICHYVILSYKNHQFLSVTLLFCLQKTSVSLCHYVIMSSKKTSVSFRPSVILSSKNICLTLSLCHSVFKKNICLLPSLCYSVFKTTPSVSPVLMLLCLQNYPVYLCH